MNGRSPTVPTRPSVLLVRESEQQMSSSGCCGRLEGDFLRRDGEPIFAERRAGVEAMGPLYRAVRARFGDDVEINVVDPRSFVALLILLVRDFWKFHVGLREAARTLFRLPVIGVIVNGRLLARNSWPPAEELLQRLEEEGAGPAPAPGVG